MPTQPTTEMKIRICVFTFAWYFLSSMQCDIVPVIVEDPDPFVFGPPGSGSVSQRSRILLSRKIVRKNIESYCFVNFMTFYL